MGTLPYDVGRGNQHGAFAGFIARCQPEVSGFAKCQAGAQVSVFQSEGLVSDQAQQEFAYHVLSLFQALVPWKIDVIENSP